jgi:DNA repair photolyase
METKQIKGKALYMPSGKAGEYAKYACNFYAGCSNDCSYCYCKRGVLGHSMGKPQATLKKCFKDEEHAFEVFRKEVKANLEVLRKHGLFFTFTSDPMLENTRQLTINAVGHAASFGIPCKILTKRADFIDNLPGEWLIQEWYRSKIAFGFTLTGHDELEHGASTNAERIECMRNLHNAGFKTFASIEPIIDLKSSYKMIKQTLGFCDLYKIGLLSGHKDYTKHDVMDFVNDVDYAIFNHSYSFPDYKTHIKVYWKDSVLDYIGMNRDDFPEGFYVGADYDMFNNK